MQSRRVEGWVLPRDAAGRKAAHASAADTWKDMARKAVEGTLYKGRWGKMLVRYPQSIHAHALNFVPGATRDVKCRALALFKSNKPVAVRPGVGARYYIDKDGKTSLIRGPCGDIFSVAAAKQPNKQHFHKDASGHLVLQPAPAAQRRNYYYKRVAAPLPYIRAVTAKSKWSARNADPSKTGYPRFSEHVNKYRKQYNKWKDAFALHKAAKTVEALDRAEAAKKRHMHRVVMLARDPIKGLPYHWNIDKIDLVTKPLHGHAERAYAAAKGALSRSKWWAGPPVAPPWVKSRSKTGGRPRNLTTQGGRGPRSRTVRKTKKGPRLVVATAIGAQPSLPVMAGLVPAPRSRAPRKGRARKAVMTTVADADDETASLEEVANASPQQIADMFPDAAPESGPPLKPTTPNYAALGLKGIQLTQAKNAHAKELKAWKSANALWHKRNRA